MFLNDLNRNNPLGQNGMMAQTYYQVLQHLWKGVKSSFNPEGLKKLISNIAPQFLNNQQHDSHELLCYLLDGLHQDLNRIQIKPYYQNGASNLQEGSAEREWEKHLERNSSIIVDLFHGQYKQTIYCPGCKKNSYTFDPFNSLSLSIPVEQVSNVQVCFVFADSKKLPLSLNVPVFPDTQISFIRKFLASNLQIKPYSFLLLSVYLNQINEFLQEDSVLSFPYNDILFAYEIKTNSKNPDIFQLKIYKETNILKPIAYPRVVFIDHQKLFLDLHQAIFQKFRPYMSSNSNFQKFQEAPQYHVKLEASEIKNCALCQRVYCKGCFLPVSKTSFSQLQSENLLSLEIVWKESSQIQFTQINKCVDFRTKQKVTKKPITLQECFQHFTEPETLDQQNSIYCSRCKTLVSATKRIQIYKAPKYLIVHLKRFKSRGMIREKISRPVIFKGKGMNISEFVIGPQKPRVYDLYAVANHYGSLSQGHYTATCFNSVKKMWVEFNDSNLSYANELSSNFAYILFYKQRNN